MTGAAIGCGIGTGLLRLEFCILHLRRVRLNLSLHGTYINPSISICLSIPRYIYIYTYIYIIYNI